MTPAATVVLKPGRERPVQQRHPWVFSGAIARTEGGPHEAGQVVEVYSASREWLARGTWSTTSQIRVRLFSWHQDEHIDNMLLQHRLERALAGRRANLQPWYEGADACRLVYAESDGLPGLIVDRYGDYLVMQLLTQGTATRSAQIGELLAALCQPRGIYERSDVEVRQKEGLPLHDGVCLGAAPPEHLQLQLAAGPTSQGQPAAPLHMLSDLRAGQKTGLYLDQALNRGRVAAYCADKEVLDCFCYSGGFSLYAASAGARHITALDSSPQALALLQQHMALNNQTTALEAVAGDVFKLLRQYRGEGRQFDVVILDPPKFAHSRGHIERATRGYKDIQLQAMHLLRSGGLLATFSCSGLISADLFQKVVFGAAIDAGRAVQIIERFTQAPDHPVLVSFPESEYLKGLLCRVW